MKTLREYIEQVEESYDDPAVGDYFDLEIARDETLIETYVVDVLEDGIVIEADDTMMRILTHVGYLTEDSNMPPAQDSTSPINGKKDALRRRKKDARAFNFETSQDTDLCEDDLEEGAEVTYFVTVEKPGTEVIEISALGPSDAKEKAESQGYRVLAVKDKYDLEEAEYRGRNVPLGKKMAGDVKKSKVYVRKPNGNVVKVEFGDPNMRIKKSNPKRRKSFRARHNCDNPGPRWKARYWSCRSW